MSLSDLAEIFKHRARLEKLSDGELIDEAFHVGCRIEWKDGEVIEVLLDRFQTAIDLKQTPEGRTIGEDSPYPDEILKLEVIL